MIGESKEFYPSTSDVIQVVFRSQSPMTFAQSEAIGQEIVRLLGQWGYRMKPLWMMATPVRGFPDLYRMPFEVTGVNASIGIPAMFSPKFYIDSVKPGVRLVTGTPVL